jgi:hypothetical protein
LGQGHHAPRFKNRLLLCRWQLLPLQPHRPGIRAAGAAGQAEATGAAGALLAASAGRALSHIATKPGRGTFRCDCTTMDAPDCMHAAGQESTILSRCINCRPVEVVAAAHPQCSRRPPACCAWTGGCTTTQRRVECG